MRIAVTLMLVLLIAPCFEGAAVAGPPPTPSNVLYGFVSSNRTLGVAFPGPTYYMPGDLIVLPGVTLTIEPGVRVVVSSADTLAGGGSVGQVELTVQGTLEAIAPFPNQIRIESANATPGQWYGIQTLGNGVVHMQGVAIRGGTLGLQLVSPGPHTLDNLDISGVVYGIDGGNSTFALRDSRIAGRGRISGQWTGFGVSCGSNATLAFPESIDVHPTLISGFEAGLLLGANAQARNIVAFENRVPVQLSGFAVMNYCTFTKNEVGVVMNQGLLLNSIVAQNGAPGVQCFAPGYADYVDSWNSSQNFVGNSIGPHVASFSPFFLDLAGNDFRLGAGSIFKDFSNSGGELGAYGPGPGLHVSTKRASWGAVKARFR